VVRGSGIELYTEGDYASEDIDLTVASRARIRDTLMRWGFPDDGNLFSNHSWMRCADAMEGEIRGSQRLTCIISTAVGPLRISGGEDLFIRRVRESVAWQNRQEAFAHAILLLRHDPGDLDWEYIRFFARREGWEPQLEELRRRARHPRKRS
jgi:hypothetical protein